MADKKDIKPVKQKRDWSEEGDLPYERIPAFKAAYDTYKECQYRFRNVPVDGKPIAREVKEKLMRVMVCIVHARLNYHVLESLQEAMDLSLEVQITIRVMVETNAITKKDFANIVKYSSNLTRQMIGWNNSAEAKNKRTSVQTSDNDYVPKSTEPSSQMVLTDADKNTDNRRQTNILKQLSLFEDE